MLILTHSCLLIYIYLYNESPGPHSLSLSLSFSHNNSENVQGSPLYILPLPNNRVMKLHAIYSILLTSFHNIFIEKEKYNEQ